MKLLEKRDLVLTARITLNKCFGFHGIEVVKFCFGQHSNIQVYNAI